MGAFGRRIHHVHTSRDTPSSPLPVLAPAACSASIHILLALVCFLAARPKPLTSYDIEAGSEGRESIHAFLGVQCLLQHSKIVMIKD